jgi:hypothetical protein
MQHSSGEKEKMNGRSNVRLRENGLAPAPYCEGDVEITRKSIARFEGRGRPQARALSESSLVASATPAGDVTYSPLYGRRRGRERLVLV